MNATPDKPPVQEPHLRTADGAILSLRFGETVAGRDPSCDMQLRDRSVSKTHCAFRRSEGGVLVTDLGSTNHTFVNHICLREGQSSPLVHGDRVILGRTILIFVHPAHAAGEKEVSGAESAVHGRSPSESTIVSFDVGPPLYPSSKEEFSEGAFRELRKANERLSVFYDFGRYVGNLLDIGQLLRGVARRIMKLVPADSGVIFLRRVGQYEPSLCWTREGFQELSRATYSRTAVTRAMEERRGIFIRDIGSEPGLSEAQSVRELRIKSTMIVPIILENEVFGALCLSGCGRRADFGPDDFAMISGITGQIAVAIKNADLADEIKRTTAERERLQRELEIAANVQKSILPQAPPPVAGLDIGGASVPAREVGGDFFDYIPLGSDSLGTTIADVSGKGLAAALLTLQSKNVIHAFARQRLSPAEVLQKANGVVYDDYRRAEMFLSVFYATIDAAIRVMRYASAGHNPPLLLRGDGSCSYLEPTGNLIGISPNLAISEETMELGDNDVLALYTDGISEARDVSGCQFGCERLAEKLTEHRGLPAGEIADLILREVCSLAGPSHFDDATLVVIKVQPVP